MHIVGADKLNDKELQELDSISHQMTVNYMRLATDIYHGILTNMLLRNEKELLWAQHCSLGAVLCHGYRMGVQAERQKQRAKRKYNKV